MQLHTSVASLQKQTSLQKHPQTQQPCLLPHLAPDCPLPVALQDAEQGREGGGEGEMKDQE